MEVGVAKLPNKFHFLLYFHPDGNHPPVNGALDRYTVSLCG